MKAIILTAFLFAGLALAQNPPDCVLQGNSILITAPGSVPLPQGYDNRALGCQTWTVWYISENTGFTVSFQSSLGTNTPDGYTAYTGTMVSSSTGFGTAMVGVATFTSLSATPGLSVETPWVQVNVTGAAAPIRIGFYGYRTGATGGTGGGGGGGGGGSGCPNPCPVLGTGTAGTPNAGVVSVQGVSGGTVLPGNETQLAGVALGAPSAFGTSPGAVNVPGANVFVIGGVLPAGLGTFTTGQQAVTATAVNLGTATAKTVCVHALIANTINVYAGPTGTTITTGQEIPPGQGYCWQVNNTNLIFVVASTTGASVSWSLTN